MDKEELKKRLLKCGLKKKELADILGINVQTVSNWGGSHEIPYWLPTWLENYEKAQKLEKIIELVTSSSILASTDHA